MVDEVIATAPWMTEISKFIEPMSRFCKNRRAMVKMLSDLEGREHAIEDILEFFGGE